VVAAPALIKKLPLPLRKLVGDLSNKNEVLLGLDLKQWRPRVIVTEDYASRNQLKAKYLEAHGYQLGGQCSENAMWIRPASELRE